MSTRKEIEEVYKMSGNEFVWKPLYPNNMINNGIEGYYCLALRKDKDGKVSGRKYTILFQNEEREAGTGFVDSEKINAYILFEKSYWNVVGPLEYPEPCEYTPNDLWHSSENTFSSSDMNDYGTFIYAYKDLETAKKRALGQYKAIYGYVASHFLED